MSFEEVTKGKGCKYFQQDTLQKKAEGKFYVLFLKKD
jgi:hypothetical protein